MFSEVVAAHRRRLGLSQEQVATRAGLSVRTVRNVESGRILAPRPGTVRLLADAFGLTGAARDRFHEAGAGVLSAAPVGYHGTAPPHQLPMGVPGFTARDAELATLDAFLGDALARPGAIVISGTAGVGKTALAIHWAARVADRFPDGQLYVNLRGFEATGSSVAPAEVLSGFLLALSVPADQIPAELEARAALYRSVLADRRVLVVLDNARDAEQVRPLLPGSSQPLVLVTSRDQLSGLVAAEGAGSLLLDLLHDAAARRLLASRIGPQRLAAEPAAVQTILRSCANLPLALAVVAARAAMRPGFPLAAVVADLGDGDGAALDALADGDARTDLRAVFSWSYRALDAPTARMFRVLGLPPGGEISVPAAAALAGVPRQHARKLLAELVRGSLLSEAAPGRHRLHDLLRAYAAQLCESADPGEPDAARLRVLDHYLHSACHAAHLVQPQWEPVTPQPPAPGVAPEVPADHAAALAWFRTELPVLLPLVRWAADHGFDAHAAQLALALATFLTPNGLWREQLQTQLVAQQAAHRLGDQLGEGLTNRLLSRAYTRLGRYDLAAAHLDRALALFEEVGAADRLALAHHNYAEMYQRLGRPHDALPHSHEAVRLYRATGNRAGEARARNGVGYCHAVIGDYREALRSCRAAAAIQQELGDRNGLAATYTSIAFAHQQLGAYQDAELGFRQALRLFEENADRYQLGATWHELGNCRHAAGDLGAARAAWHQALSILEELGDPAAERIRGKLDELAAVVQACNGTQPET